MENVSVIHSIHLSVLRTCVCSVFPEHINTYNNAVNCVHNGRQVSDPLALWLGDPTLMAI